MIEPFLISDCPFGGMREEIKMIDINDTPCMNYEEQAEQFEIDEYREQNRNDIEEQRYYERD